MSNDKQVYIVTKLNRQIAAIVGRCFSKTKTGLYVSALLKIFDIIMTKQGRRKLGYIITVKTRSEQI